MYLSRIDMEMSAPRIRAALSDPQKMHCLLTGLYQNSRKESSLLYRIKTSGNKAFAYQYANGPVLRDKLGSGLSLGGERCMDDWLSGIQSGQIWGFDIITMPFRKERRENGENSRRRGLRNESERLEWLSRKAKQNGFSVLNVQETKDEKLHIYHPFDKGGKIVMDSFRYTGMLIITDAALFRSAVCDGIGPGKAYGMGMLLLGK